MLGEAHATGGGTRGAMGAPEQTLALPSRQWLGEKMAREGAQMKVTSHVQVPVSLGVAPRVWPIPGADVHVWMPCDGRA